MYTSPWIILPAAGLAKRMGSAIPKQYLSLFDKTLLEHSVERLLSAFPTSTLVIALHPEDKIFGRLSLATHPQVMTVLGGNERSDSVMNALSQLQTLAHPDDWVLIHDAARCCVLPSKIQQLHSELYQDNVGGILAVPASDTLKQLTHPPHIGNTLDRTSIWQAQTPQLFRFQLLLNSLREAQQHQMPTTDEASAIEFAGLQAKVVMGHYDNLKVTHPSDLMIAKAIMKQQLETATDQVALIQRERIPS